MRDWISLLVSVFARRRYFAPRLRIVSHRTFILTYIVTYDVVLRDGQQGRVEITLLKFVLPADIQHDPLPLAQIELNPLVIWR